MSLEKTLIKLIQFKEDLNNYVAPPNKKGWSLSNLSACYWNDLGECINEIEEHLKQDKPPEYEYYMHRKGAYYFRNETEKLKKAPDMSDQLQFDFYNAVRSRGYGVRYKFVNY